MTISHCEGALRPARQRPVLSGDLHTTGWSVAKTAKEGLAELPDHAVPPVLAGTAILEMALGNLGQAKGIVKLPVGEQSGV